MTDFFDQMSETGPGEFVQGGHYKTAADKVESYTERIVRSILSAGNASAGMIKHFAAEEAGRMGWTSWLNDRTSFPWMFEACRIFNFNFFDLLFKSKIDKHPLYRMWLEHNDNWPDVDKIILVFRIAVYGDMVMLHDSSLAPRQSEVGFWMSRPDIEKPFEIWPFKEFLKLVSDTWQAPGA